jgi:C4-type Zn-finger protein
MNTETSDPRVATCPWCRGDLQLAFPADLISRPESAKVTKPGLELDPNARLVEAFDCPNCGKELKVTWFGGIRW